MPDDTLRQIGAYATPLAAHLLDDCEVMACYAAANGIAMPEWLGNALAKIGAKAQASREEIQRIELEPGGGDQQKIGERAAGYDSRLVLPATHTMHELSIVEALIEQVEAEVRAAGHQGES